MCQVIQFPHGDKPFVMEGELDGHHFRRQYANKATPYLLARHIIQKGGWVHVYDSRLGRGRI